MKIIIPDSDMIPSKWKRQWPAKPLIEGALTQEESWTMTGARSIDPRTDSRL